MHKIFAAVFGLLFFICSVCSAYAPEGRLIVTMLDVGQGDSFLIETPTQNVLIDTGDVDCGIADKLKNAGISRIEKIILTHPHADHIGGTKDVLDNFPVDEICDNGIASSSPFYKNYRSADVKFSSLKTGDIVDLGGGVKFRVLNPEPALVKAVNAKAQRSKPNYESIIGKLTFGDFSMLFTADADANLELELVQKFDLKANILKASHHGSRKSSNPNFVANVNPQFVFISAGKDNKFGHPHKEPLATFREQYILPENIFCTRFNGNVRVETDGHNFIVLPDTAVDWIVDYTREFISVTRLD